MDFKPISEMGVATQIRPAYCTTIGFHGGFQQPFLENEFGNWVWTFGMPTQPCGWSTYVFCILLLLIIKVFSHNHANCNFLQTIVKFYN